MAHTQSGSGHIVDGEYLKQIEGARRDLHNLLKDNKQFAPIVLRLAFHDAGTYDASTKTGGVNVEVTGGPHIPFVPGRPDAPNQQDSGALPNPNGDVKHLRDIFYRMGLNDRDIVVLSGAHTLGRVHKDRTPGFDGPFTEDPLKFDNSYFIGLRKADTPGLVKLPTDKALLEEPVLRRYVQIYAQDEKTFFDHYAQSHKKMSELGFNPPRCHVNA
ncbi:L-ascorbate peroxidase 5 peroxisomal [Bienertia sinuspersici]